MKRVLVVVCVGLTIMAVSMMSGCAGQKPVDDATYQTNFFVSSDQGATKQAIYLGDYKDGGFFVGNNDGESKAGIYLGDYKDGGFFVGNNDGESKASFQWPQPK